MGRKAKLRKQRKPITVTLSGEQAEVFDQQMESDHDWFEGTTECVRFRPEIEGEFDTYQMLGQRINGLVPFDSNGAPLDVPLDWVCVVEVSRALTGKAHGIRVRIPCPAPRSGVWREQMAKHAMELAPYFASVIQANGT